MVCTIATKTESSKSSRLFTFILILTCPNISENNIHTVLSVERLKIIRIVFQFAAVQENVYCFIRPSKLLRRYIFIAIANRPSLNNAIVDVMYRFVVKFVH